jgi:bifunctional non-homologous end joining protein LigD
LQRPAFLRDYQETECAFQSAGYLADLLNSNLVGYYKGHDLKHAASVHSGISAELRRGVLPHFEKLHKPRCPFANLPERTKGRWREGLTAAKMSMCRWLDPFLVVRVEFLEWTPEDRLRHPRFAGIRSDKDATEVMRE